MSDIAVCLVGKSTYYGTEIEHTAARLNKGDKVLFKGETETVDYVWFYDGPIVSLVGGKAIFPALGDVFTVTSTRE